MRITRELLHKFARQSAEEMTQRDRKILCVYLTGSLLTAEPLLGNTTDIDLFVVYNDTPPAPRQVKALTEEVHLDLAYLPVTLFRQPRQQRVDPWLAPFLCQNPLCLHDTQHWFEFTQAAVCAQYDRPEYRVQRARPFMEAARQAWSDLSLGKISGLPTILRCYLHALEDAANVIASLTGAPLAGRRFMQQFPQRCMLLKRPGLAGGIADLFMPQTPSTEEWETLLAGWRQTLQAAAALPDVPPALSACRIRYYEQAARALTEDHPAAALWIALNTWTRAVCLLPAENAAVQTWKDGFALLELDVEHLDLRLEGLDAYLDTVEETLDAFAKAYGVT